MEIYAFCTFLILGFSKLVEAHKQVVVAVFVYASTSFCALLFRLSLVSSKLVGTMATRSRRGGTTPRRIVGGSAVERSVDNAHGFAHIPMPPLAGSGAAEEGAAAAAQQGKSSSDDPTAAAIQREVRCDCLM